MNFIINPIIKAARKSSILPPNNIAKPAAPKAEKNVILFEYLSLIFIF